MWKNLKFSVKVMVLVAVMALFTVLTAVGYHNMSNQIRDIGINSAGEEMLTGYKNELEDMVTMMANTLAVATEGMTEADDIQKMYSKLIRDVRFLSDESGYFFIYEGGVNFVHAVMPDIEGKDLTNLKDANGAYLIQELDKIAKAGGGFFEYWWDKPGEGNKPKLSYYKMIPNSPYAIGAGIYIDDIQEKEARIFKKINDFSNEFLLKWSIILLLGFFVIVLPAIIIMIKSMTSPLMKLTEVASDYSRGALDSDIEYVDRKDEIGALSRAIKRLGSSTRIVMKKLEEANINR